MASGQGVQVVDFGAFPGQSDVTQVVTATGCSATSRVEAWFEPVDTTTANGTHTKEEHEVMANEMHPTAHSQTTNQFSITIVAPNNPGGGNPNADGLRMYGPWTCGWCWSD